MMQHNTAQHSTAQHSTAQHDLVHALKNYFKEQIDQGNHKLDAVDVAVDVIAIIRQYI